MRHWIVNVQPRFSVYLHDTLPASLATSKGQASEKAEPVMAT